MANRQVINETVDAYANTLLDTAVALGGRDQVVAVRNQIIELLGIMATNIDLRLALDDEVYTIEQREEIVRKVFCDFDPLLVELLVVMSAHQDVFLLRRVHNHCQELIETKLNFSIVDVTTVVELDDHLREVISKKAESDLGRDCILVEHIDPSIMGGIIMDTRGRHIDATVRKQFDQARLVLKKKDGGEC